MFFWGLLVICILLVLLLYQKMDNGDLRVASVAALVAAGAAGRNLRLTLYVYGLF